MLEENRELSIIALATGRKELEMDDNQSLQVEAESIMEDDAPGNTSLDTHNVEPPIRVLHRSFCQEEVSYYS